MTYRKLNLGCGKDIRDEWINLDKIALPGVDVVVDVEHAPLPFDDDEFDEILCKDILEHVEYIPVLRELHRVLSPKGILEIRVPHFTSRENFVDPTHKEMFSISTFDFFIKNQNLVSDYYFDFAFSRICYSKITFYKKRIFIFNYIVECMTNCHSKMQKLYESTFMSRLFPAEYIVIRLIK